MFTSTKRAEKRFVCRASGDGTQTEKHAIQTAGLNSDGTQTGKKTIQPAGSNSGGTQTGKKMMPVTSLNSGGDLLNDSMLITEDSTKQGSLILVNRDHPLPSPAPSVLAPVLSDFPLVKMERRAASCLYQLLCACGGLAEIIPVSGFRSQKEQAEIYENSLIENGEKFTSMYVARPLCSEHQSGLAIDLAAKCAYPRLEDGSAAAADEIDFICPAFPEPAELRKLPAGKAAACGNFRRLAARYGFVQRYTEDKESLTGIACEPWHFRYTGYPHSYLMTQKNLCLEEYIEYLENFHAENPLSLTAGGRLLKIFCASAGDVIDAKAEAFLSPANFSTTQKHPISEYSGTNTGKCVITVWH